MKIYIASSFSLIPAIKQAVSRLEADGHEITVRWWERLALKKQFMVLTPDEFYAEPECENAFRRDLEGIKEADCLLFITSDTPRMHTGANIEVGMAFGVGIPVYSLGTLTNSAMYWGVKRCSSLDEFMIVCGEQRK